MGERGKKEGEREEKRREVKLKNQKQQTICSVS